MAEISEVISRMKLKIVRILADDNGWVSKSVNKKVLEKRTFFVVLKPFQELSS